MAVAADAGRLVLALGLGLEDAAEHHRLVELAAQLRRRYVARRGPLRPPWLRPPRSSRGGRPGCCGTLDRTMRRWWRSAASARVGVAGGDRRDDVAVLGDHLAEVAGLGQAEPADAVEVAVRAAAQRPGDLVAAQLAEQAVERLVERGRTPRRRRSASARSCAARFACSSASPARSRARSRGGSRCTRAPRARRRRPRRRRADQRDERAELRHDRDEPLVAQAHERLAHGRAADAEQLGELVLGQAPAGLQLGGDDRLAQRGVHLIAGRPAAGSIAQLDTHVY